MRCAACDAPADGWAESRIDHFQRPVCETCRTLWTEPPHVLLRYLRASRLGWAAMPAHIRELVTVYDDGERVSVACWLRRLHRQVATLHDAEYREDDVILRRMMAAAQRILPQRPALAPTPKTSRVARWLAGFVAALACRMPAWSPAR